MIDFARENKLFIMNTWFKHPEKHQFTWYSNDVYGTKKHLTTCYAPTGFVNMFLTVVSEDFFMNDELTQQNFLENLEERFSQVDDINSVDEMDAELSDI